MKKITSILLGISAIFAAVSCEEFTPVFTGKYPEPAEYQKADMEANTTIAELKAMYVKSPVKIEDDIIIKGQLTTSDKTGNFYRSFYIQDETGGIEIKIGKTGLYNDYKLGQWVYVNCSGLTLGNYRGMVNLGYEDPTNEYETSYIDVQYLIDTHIFRGELDDPVAPLTLSEEGLAENSNYGKLVKVSGLVYDNHIFCLAYVDPDGDRKDYTDNAFFLDEEHSDNWGVTTWAMSETKFEEYLENGNFDTAEVAGTTVAEMRKKDPDKIKPAAYSVSQYFKMGSTTVQVRTSGYARFADTEMDARILDGAEVEMTGILSVYNGEVQFTLLDLDGVKIL